MQPPVAPRTSAPVWQVLLAVATGLWIVFWVGLSPLFHYGVDLVSLVTNGDLAPVWIPVAAALTAALLAVVPAALIGWLPRSPGVRAAGQAWAWAGVAFALLSAARLVPVVHHEIYLGVLSSAAGLTALLLRRLPGGAPARWDADPWSARLTAVAGGGAMLLPWAWAGALGGGTETVAGAAAATTLGWLSGVVLRRGRAEGSWARRVLLGGLVAGVALVPLAAGAGGSGVSLALLLVLPPLGFAAAALGRGAGLLPGLAAAGPLLFVDPEETSLVLGTNDVGYWAAISAAVALGVAMVVNVLFAVNAGRRVPLHRPVAAALAAVVVAGLGAVYAGLGQPGWHGERLFVALTTQADLTGVEAIADRDQRLRETYRRLVDTAERTQRPLRTELRRLKVRFRPYYLVNGLEVEAGPAVRGWLAQRPGVRRVLTNPVLRPLPAAPRPMRGTLPAPVAPQWNVEAVQAPRVWSELGVRGAGVVIGSPDSGVDGAHPALAAGFRGGDDSWYDPWNGSSAPTDRNGHGTHTLGTALGSGGVGVAPDAKWVGCVNLDRNLGNPARYLDCLQFMLAPFPRGGDPLRDGRPERAPHVLTNSWGCPPIEGCDRQVLRPALAALRAAGIFFVAAAGNTGPSCGSIVDEPAIIPEAFTVGAVDSQRRVASFSSRGPVPGAAGPDVVAPGVAVPSALPGGGYGPLDGTSMAAPHLAGVAALMWSANPRLIGDVRRTAEILRATAQPLSADPALVRCGGPRNVVGAGLVNAHAAVSAARAIQ